MRLINTHTIQLEEIWDVKATQYAILSHRWEDDEVSYQDFDTAHGRQKKGFTKIRQAVAQSLEGGFGYLWCDTCCIDKTSSAELSEAINSMFMWYQRAAVCYTYLSDVTVDKFRGAVPKSFLSSAWFTRGWTLQELIAPKNVIFFDSDWNYMGTKLSLSSVISHVTGVDEEILAGGSVSERSIAQRMSWASSRITSRIEDTAYCLLGIFDVNMPLLYGEGEKAFLRLQEEIIRQSDDHSIFCWPRADEDHSGLLAAHPMSFSNCRYVTTTTSRRGGSAYSMTNRGLAIKLDATPWSTDTYLVALHCVDKLLHKSNKPIDQFHMGMFLRRLNDDDQYARINYEGETFIQVESSIWTQIMTPEGRVGRPVERLEINVRQKRDHKEDHCFVERIHGFRICTPELLEKSTDGTVTNKYNVDAPRWDETACLMTTPASRFGTVGVLDISPQHRKIKAIKLGFDFAFNPVIFVAESGGLDTKTHAFDRNGKVNFESDTQLAQWSADEHVQFHGIHRRSCLGDLGWSEVDHSTGTARQLRHHPGLWALKGDRVSGLHLQLQDTPFPTEATLTTVQIKRGWCGEKLVWDVYVHNLRDSTMRTLKKSKFLSSSSSSTNKNFAAAAAATAADVASSSGSAPTFDPATNVIDWSTSIDSHRRKQVVDDDTVSTASTAVSSTATIRMSAFRLFK